MKGIVEAEIKLLFLVQMYSFGQKLVKNWSKIGKNFAQDFGEKILSKKLPTNSVQKLFEKLAQKTIRNYYEKFCQKW